MITFNLGSSRSEPYKIYANICIPFAIFIRKSLFAFLSLIIQLCCRVSGKNITSLAGENAFDPGLRIGSGKIIF